VRLGGASTLEAMVNLLYEKVLEDEELQPFFHGVSVDFIKSHQVTFLSMAFDGPNPHRKFNVDIMVLAHTRLLREKGLAKKHFDLFVQHLMSSLQQLNIPQLLINEVMAIVGPLRRAFESQRHGPELDILSVL
jgi:hemoglobin